ncbi:conserved hypothetical protein [Ricinus communis]|uniref:Transposase MuDR plant domain-containing protein n=1 Tax=Ricinus communis TaxID=3988 RepID=B9S5N8_RICCO|nr:conserved hypothetical protein [Ricinus communis]
MKQLATERTIRVRVRVRVLVKESNKSESDYESDIEAESVELVATYEDNNESSDVDDELRAVRDTKRKFLRRKRRKDAEDGFVKVPLREVGHDQGYENWNEGDNKYEGKVGGDEKYYGSNDLRLKRGMKVYYDPEYKLPIWKIEMVFENAVQFRNVVSKYDVHRGVQLKLRPNESHKVRVKCKKVVVHNYFLEALKEHAESFIIKTYKPFTSAIDTTKMPYLT